MKKYAIWILTLAMILSAVEGLHAGIVYLNDENIVFGRLVSSNDTAVVLDTTVGQVTIRMSLIKEVIADDSNFNAVMAEKISNVSSVLIATHAWNRRRLNNLQQVSDGLPKFYRATLYEQFQKRKPIFYAAANFVPTLGSWLQGDYRGAISELVFTGLGTAAFIVGLRMDEPGVYSTGAVVSALAYLNGFARPFRYTRKWNEAVREGMQITFVPEITGLTVAANDTRIEVRLIGIGF